MGLIKEQINKIYHEGKSAIAEPDLGVKFKNDSVISRRRNDNVQKYNGRYNTFIGHNSGKLFFGGSENILIGKNSGEQMNETDLKKPNANTFIGTNSGQLFKNGSSNIFLGYNVCKDIFNTDIINSITIGTDSINEGDGNLLLGNFSSIPNDIAIDSTLIGNESINSASNSIILGKRSYNNGVSTILIGNDLSNCGNNSIIIGHSISNCSNDFINLNNVLYGTIGDTFNFADNISLLKNTTVSNLDVDENIHIRKRIHYGYHKDINSVDLPVDITPIFEKMKDFVVRNNQNGVTRDSELEGLIKLAVQPVKWLEEYTTQELFEENVIRPYVDVDLISSVIIPEINNFPWYNLDLTRLKADSFFNNKHQIALYKQFLFSKVCFVSNQHRYKI